MIHERRAALTRRLISILVPALALACAGPRDEGARIVLERTGRGDGWRATYILERPARELRFQRPAAFHREDSWKVVTPGWRLQRRGDYQLLATPSGAPTNRVEVEFSVRTEELPKEYEAFVRFTDGSLAVYTGHLYVTTEPPPDDGARDEANYLRRVELVPRDGEHVVIRGERITERTVWDDADADGTYVYVGAIEPLETEQMIAVIDPGAPAWLRERLHRALPELFELYGERFGERLRWKPVVLFNFENVEQRGLSSGGGTLTGLVQMSASGSAWHEANLESATHLLYLIAHEAVHLWNGQLHTYADAADSWMHEGSADAFADLALLESGTIDAARLAERRTTALNRCVAGLAEGPLREAGTRGQFRDYYACGNLIAVWSVGVLGDPTALDRLFDVWRGVFAHDAEGDSRYDRESYFRALARLGAGDGAVERLRAFVDERHHDPVTDVVEFLGSAGIDVVVLDRPSPPLRQERASAVLRHLMGQACAGRISFHAEWPRLRTAPLEACEPFRDELRIVAIEGQSVDSDGDLALAATAERCRAGQPVTLGLEGGATATVPCIRPPAAPLSPLGFPVI